MPHLQPVFICLLNFFPFQFHQIQSPNLSSYRQPATWLLSRLCKWGRLPPPPPPKKATTTDKAGSIHKCIVATPTLESLLSNLPPGWRWKSWSPCHHHCQHGKRSVRWVGKRHTLLAQNCQSEPWSAIVPPVSNRWTCHSVTGNHNSGLVKLSWPGY